MTGSADAVARELERLAGVGLDLHGFVSSATWDLCAGPAHAGAARPLWLRTAIVVGGRGAGFAQRALAASAHGGRDPIDAAARGALDAATRRLTAAGLRVEAVFAHVPGSDPVGDDRFCDLVGLAAAAGLGWPSRLGLLLHPEAGPWIHLRAALLLDLALEPSAPLRDPAPCTACPAPCRVACPGGAIAEGFDVAVCGATRIAVSGCADHCGARRACPVGAAFAYPDEVEAWHMRHAVAHLPPSK